MTDPIATIIAYYMLGVFISFILIAIEWEKHSAGQRGLNIAMSWAYVVMYVIQEIIRLIKLAQENK